jgi:hypothetical protein
MHKINFQILFICIVSCNRKKLPFFIEINKNWQLKTINPLD